MSFLRLKGIVLKEINTGEADKILTVFTAEKGKITAYAKGARRPRSRLIAGSQFLCYSDFVLFRGRDMYIVSSSDVIEPFYELRNDIVKLTYSAYFSDLVYDTVQENEPSKDVLKLLLNTLYMLSKTSKPPELLARIFELRLLAVLGYAPGVYGCVECGWENFEKMSFSFEKCGLLCSECARNDKTAIPVHRGTARAMNHIVNSRPENLFNFELSGEILGELEKISRRYLRERLEKDYNRLDFLKEL